MSNIKDIKKRLSLSSTLPMGAAPMLTGSHLHSHPHGPDCGCSQHSHDKDDEEE